jgi:hypothetical protein
MLHWTINQKNTLTFFNYIPGVRPESSNGFISGIYKLETSGCEPE